MIKIKICGLMRKEDVDAVNVALPDYIGFVFARSRRQIDVSQAKVLKAYLDHSIKTVGVFVNEDEGNIIKLCVSGVIDFIQLHGDEGEEYIMKLRDNVPNQIIKAFRIREQNDIIKAMQFPCDYFLLDTYHGGQYGGTGKAFDWSFITDITKPYFLAGGINIDNIDKAIDQCSPYCIDVSSGVETNGYKDQKKVIEIVARARQT